jgi:hypothetical protein
MKIIPSDDFKAELLRLGRKDLAKGFEVDDEAYSRHWEESWDSHPYAVWEKRHQWAAYSAATLNKKPAVSFFTEKLFLWSWRIALLIAIVIAIACYTRGF